MSILFHFIMMLLTLLATLAICHAAARKHGSWLLVLLLACSASATTLEVEIRDFTFSPRARQIQLIPVSIPTVGTNSITLFSAITTNASAGHVYFSNIVAGNYQLKIFDPSSNLVFNIGVYDTNGVLNAKYILTNTVTLVTNILVLSQHMTNWALTSTNVLLSLQPASANLTNWSAIATTTKQPASSTLSNWNQLNTNIFSSFQLATTNLTNWSNTSTSEVAFLAGGTFTGPVYSSSSSSNEPAHFEFPNAGWVRSLFSNGALLYNNSVQAGTAFADDTYLYSTTIPATFSRTYSSATLSNNAYFGSLIEPTRRFVLNGPILVSAYITSSGGAASANYTVHPEIYYTYDTNTVTLYGDWEAQNQTIVHGAVTNRYDWTIAVPSTVATNTTGFYLVRRFKVGVKTGSDDLKITGGTNYPSSISIPASASAALGGLTTTWTNFISGVITQRITAIGGVIVTNETISY